MASSTKDPKLIKKINQGPIKKSKPHRPRTMYQKYEAEENVKTKKEDIAYPEEEGNSSDPFSDSEDEFLHQI